MWSRVPTDSEPRRTSLAKDSSIYKRQTHSLIRVGVPVERKKRRYLSKSNIYLVMSSRWGSTPRLKGEVEVVL
jgi:hypothetical protein